MKATGMSEGYLLCFNQDGFSYKRYSIYLALDLCIEQYADIRANAIYGPERCLPQAGGDNGHFHPQP